MKKAFRLAKVLKWRKIKEDMAKRELGQKVRVFNEVDTSIKRLENDILQIRSQLMELQQGEASPDVQQIRVLYGYLNHLYRSRYGLDQAVEQVKTDVQQAQHALREKVTQRKVLSQLEERHHALQQQAYSKQERYEEDQEMIMRGTYGQFD